MIELLTHRPHKIFLSLPIEKNEGFIIIEITIQYEGTGTKLNRYTQSHISPS